MLGGQCRLGDKTWEIMEISTFSSRLHEVRHNSQELSKGLSGYYRDTFAREGFLIVGIESVDPHFLASRLITSVKEFFIPYFCICIRKQKV